MLHPLLAVRFCSGRGWSCPGPTSVLRSHPGHKQPRGSSRSWETPLYSGSAVRALRPLPGVVEKGRSEEPHCGRAGTQECCSSHRISHRGWRSSPRHPTPPHPTVLTDHIPQCHVSVVLNTSGDSEPQTLGSPCRCPTALQEEKLFLRSNLSLSWRNARPPPLPELLLCPPRPLCAGVTVQPSHPCSFMGWSFLSLRSPGQELTLRLCVRPGPQLQDAAADYKGAEFSSSNIPTCKRSSSASM